MCLCRYHERLEDQPEPVLQEMEARQLDQAVIRKICLEFDATQRTFTMVLITGSEAISATEAVRQIKEADGAVDGDVNGRWVLLQEQVSTNIFPR